MLLAHVAQLLHYISPDSLSVLDPTVSVKIIQNLNYFDRNSGVEIFKPLLVKYFHSRTAFTCMFLLKHYLKAI